MATIAQQDNLYLEIADYTNPSDAEKRQLQAWRDQGVLFDVILGINIIGEDAEFAMSKVIAFVSDQTGDCVIVYGGNTLQRIYMF